MNNMRRSAIGLCDNLAEVCERIEIGGSIRRGSREPRDIEIVAVPKTEKWQATMFGDDDTERDLLDEVLEEWLQAGVLRHRRDKNGRAAWGDRFKRTLFDDGGQELIPVDFFIVLPPAQWGVIFTIRTGPADFSHALVTSRLQGGAMPPDMHVKDGQLWQGGGVLETPEEVDFFQQIGLPFIAPENRNLTRLRMALR